jgi:hypothetical protein
LFARARVVGQTATGELGVKERQRFSRTLFYVLNNKVFYWKTIRIFFCL